MANHLYGYSSSYGALPQSQPPPPGVSAATSNLSALYSSRSLSLSDPYLPDSTRYLYHRHFDADRPSSMYEILRYSGTDIGGYSSTASRIPGVGTTAAAQQGSWSAVDVDAAIDPVVTGIKRAADEAIYHQTLYGAHSTIGQSEAWYSTNSLAKRPRFESAINLPIYPQRPGEKDCAHYMLTRTCKFGDSCKYDHPIWVPEGGIPDWKEVPQIASDESLPERPGEPDCPYYLKTQRCKFGPRCKFNHPKDNLVTLGASENVDISALPERPSEQPCAFYMKTGKCKFGVTCKFHHPKDIQIPLAGEDNGNTEQTESAVNTYGTIGDAKAINPLVLPTTALLHNSKGLPIRLGEVDCPFYLKTGSCKYGATCRYNHPDRIGSAIVASPAPNLNIGVVNPAASLYQTIDPRLAQPMLGVSPTIYPQRPGQIECDFYMKTGECKFGERCKFHHPVDRSAPTQTMAKQATQQNVKLTLAGLPRREGAIICPYYLKTGTCKYGASCRFDHPPPGEVMAMAASQGISTSVDGEANEGEAVEEQQQ